MEFARGQLAAHECSEVLLEAAAELPRPTDGWAVRLVERCPSVEGADDDDRTGHRPADRSAVADAAAPGSGDLHQAGVEVRDQMLTDREQQGLGSVMPAAEQVLGALDDLLV